MEGKGVLFKKFAGIDVFDIELAETDQEKLVEIVAALEPTFGGINLEDIKAPECFYVEQKLRERLIDPGVPRRPARHGDHRRRGGAERPGAGRQGHRQGEAGRLGRGRGGAVLPGPAREARTAQGKHLGHRHQGRGLEGPQRADGSVEGALRPRHPGAQPGRGDRARRHLPRPVGRRRAQEGDGRQDGGQAADPGARQPRSGDHAGGRRRRARRRHRRHRPQRLSQPGEQRPLLPLHLPRRARCRGEDGQRRDEDRLRARARVAGAQGAVRGRGARLRRAGGRRLRRPPDHPQAVRSAADRRAGAGRRAGRHGLGRGDAADHRLRGLPPAAQPVRLQVRPGHAAGVRAGAGQPQAGDLQRRRGRSRAARRADHPRRGCRRSRS